MIHLRGLIASTDGRTILDCKNVDFERGKINAIVGPNGSGKSTLLCAICGFLSRDAAWEVAGDSLIDDLSVFSLSDSERARRIAYFPQTRPVPDLSVTNLVRHGRYPWRKAFSSFSKADADIVENSIQMVGLETFAHRKLETLSGGERQRAWLALTIAQDVDLILVDEPTTFLDIKSQIDILEILCDLRLDGKTIICVLHDLPQAFTYADKIVVIRNGKIKACGDPSEQNIMAAAGHAFGVSIRPSPINGLYKYELHRNMQIR